MAVEYYDRCGHGRIGKKVIVSSFDHSAEPNHFISGLTSAAGFFRRHLAKALTVRHIPTLIFKHDKGIENSIRVHEILNQIANER